MFTEQEIEFMKSLGLECDFNNLSEEDDYWIDIEDTVADRLQYDGFDKGYKPTSIGLMCEAILDKIP